MPLTNAGREALDSGDSDMIFSEAEKRRRRNALYIEAYAKAWAEASPAERELAVLTMKDKWSDADRERHAELTKQPRAAPTEPKE
jgi:hypothetical protein